MHAQCGIHSCSGAYIYNVKVMLIIVPSLIVDCFGFIRGLYTDIVVSYIHMS